MITMSRDALRHLIERHGGNRTAISHATGHSLNTVRRLISHHNLTGAADDAASMAQRPGPRASASEEAKGIERDALLQSLTGGARRAAALLQWSIASVYRKRRLYKITAKEIEDYRSTKPPVK